MVLRHSMGVRVPPFLFMGLVLLLCTLFGGGCSAEDKQARLERQLPPEVASVVSVDGVFQGELLQENAATGVEILDTTIITVCFFSQEMPDGGFTHDGRVKFDGHLSLDENDISGEDTVEVPYVDISDDGWLNSYAQLAVLVHMFGSFGEEFISLDVDLEIVRAGPRALEDRPTDELGVLSLVLIEDACPPAD